MTDRDRLGDAPDLYRARAQSGAGLAMTAAAAISAGVVFGGERTLSPAAAPLALVAVVALLVAVCAFAAASQHARQENVETSQLEDQIRQLVKEIRIRTRIANYAGLVAICAFVGLVALVIFDEPSNVGAEIRLNDEGFALVRAVCPQVATNSFVVTVRPDALDGDADFIGFRISESLCGRKIGTITIGRPHIQLIAGVPH